MSDVGGMVREVLRYHHRKVPAGWELGARSERTDLGALRVTVWAIKGHGMHAPYREREFELDECRLRATRQPVVDEIVAAVESAVRRLFPPPLPVFRIGTKPHAKRLAARAA